MHLKMSLSMEICMFYHRDASPHKLSGPGVINCLSTDFMAEFRTPDIYQNEDVSSGLRIICVLGPTCIPVSIVSLAHKSPVQTVAILFQMTFFWNMLTFFFISSSQSL